MDKLINPYEDFKSYLELAENKNLTFIFSNTTEAGISHDKNDNFNNKWNIFFFSNYFINYSFFKNS